MLIEFSVGNYKSFRDVETFSLVATKTKSKDIEIDNNNSFSADNNADKELNLLKSAAIYGANASGKSNFASALRFVKSFVIGSSRETQFADSIPVEEFRLSTSDDGESSFFQVVFLMDKKQYRYGFEVNSQEVVSEWLFNIPTNKEVKLFERRNGKITPSSTQFKEGKGIDDKTRNNALFLSVVAQFNGAVSQKILQWFRSLSVISGLSDLGTREYTIRCLQSDKHKDEILKFVKRLDLGIDDIQIEEFKLTDESLPKNMPEDLRVAILKNTKIDKFAVKTVHKKFDKNGKQTALEVFDIDSHESEGTKKLFSLAGPIMDTLKNGKILFIDEFDARLHPLITYEIIKLFNSNKTNPNNAQIIFATHDTNLLSNKLFRRDQIWFAEKDKNGATHLYSLAEYKVRNDASFESDYIHGKYGAIPFIGDLKQLFEGANA